MFKCNHVCLLIGFFSGIVFFTPFSSYGLGLEKTIKFKSGVTYNPDERDSYTSRSSAIVDMRLFLNDNIDFIIKDTGLWVYNITEGDETSSEFNYINDFFCNINASEYMVFSAGIINNTDGLSYVWNPMDLFVPDYDFTDERVLRLFGSERDVQNAKGLREGLLTGRIESFFDFGSFKFAYAPYISDWADHKDSNRFYTNGYNGADYYLFRFTLNSFEDWTPEMLYFRSEAKVPEKSDLDVFGFSLSKAMNDFVIIQFEATMRKSTEVDSLIIYEGGYQFQPRDPDDYYFKIVSGINIVTEESLDFIIEYYYNQEGYSGRKLEAYFDLLTSCHETWLSSTDPAAKAAAGACLADIGRRFRAAEMSRHYLFLRAAASNFIIDKLSFSVNYLVSLVDKSIFVSPSFSYEIMDELFLSVTSNHSYGAFNTEFGNLYNNSTVLNCMLSYSW